MYIFGYVLLALTKSVWTSYTDNRVEDNATMSKVDKPSTNREGKLFFPLLKVVSFDNTPCMSTSGQIGTCYSKKECAEIGGLSSGSCANGYGECCVVTATCDTKIIVRNNTYFQNSGFPSTHEATGSCTVELVLPPETVQVKLEFLVFDISGPVEGDCGNDTFSVSGFNSGKTVPILCGFNSGQHMFLDADEIRGPHKLTFSLAGVRHDRKWNIRVSFLTDYDRCKAPPRCLQYYSDISGTVSSFNHGKDDPQLLNNLSYTICFAYHRHYCDIRFIFSVIDMGVLRNGRCNRARLSFIGGTECDFETDVQREVDGSGPIVFSVTSDEINIFEQIGFQATYVYLPC